jgi:uncharacterized membrane protein YkvA (DUF1232 family)
MFGQLRSWARGLKRDLLAVSFAVADPRTPRLARFLGVAVVAYAASPIDLIPDFIPVLGYLDDLLIVPAGLWLVRRMIPPEVLAEHRARAEQSSTRLRSHVAAVAIIGVWIGVAALLAWRLV